MTQATVYTAVGENRCAVNYDTCAYGSGEHACEFLYQYWLHSFVMGTVDCPCIWVTPVCCSYCLPRTFGIHRSTLHKPS